MKTLTLLAALALSAYAQSPTYRCVTNFEADMLGTPDTSGYGGYDDVVQWNITFNPPPGYGVMILSVQGDLVSWIKTMPGDPPTPAGSTAGVLLGIQATPDPTTSGRCDLCSDMAHEKLSRPYTHRFTASSTSPTAQTPNVTVPQEVGTTFVYIQDALSAEKSASRATYSEQNVNMMLRSDNRLLVTLSSWCNVTRKPIHSEPTFSVTYQWVKLDKGQ